MRSARGNATFHATRVIHDLARFAFVGYGKLPGLVALIKPSGVHQSGEVLVESFFFVVRTE